MNPVIIESPYAGDVEGNVKYARKCLYDSLKRGEAPFASHLLYTQEGVLDDASPEERKIGIEAGFVWGARADMVAFYIDRGMSQGMIAGLVEAVRRGATIEFRSFYGEVPGQFTALCDMLTKGCET